MKKILLILLMVSCLMVPAFADGKEEGYIDEKGVNLFDGFGYSARFTNIDSFITYFDVNDSGKCSISASLQGYNGSNSKVVAKLQRYSGGSWSTIKTYTATNSSPDCGLSAKYYVTSGYSYRTVFYAYVYNGQILLDHTSITSPVQIYTN